MLDRCLDGGVDSGDYGKRFEADWFAVIGEGIRVNAGIEA